jgi:hypothetical protein
MSYDSLEGQHFSGSIRFVLAKKERLGEMRAGRLMGA